MKNDVADRTGSLWPAQEAGRAVGPVPICGMPDLATGQFPLVVIYGTPREGRDVARNLARRLSLGSARSSAVLWSGRQLLASYRDAVQTKRLEELRRFLRGAAVFAADNVEVVGRSAPAQEFLASLLDALEQAGAQAILSVGPGVAEWDCFIPRLKARLQAGLCIPYAELVLPGKDDGATESLKHESEALQAGIGREKARGEGAAHVRPGSVRRSPRWAVRAMGFLARHVARLWGVSVAELRGSARHRAVATARHVAMFLARERLSLSLKQIGRYFGGRDHTTVAHACRRIASQLARDPVLQSSIAAVDAYFSRRAAMARSPADKGRGPTT